MRLSHRIAADINARILTILPQAAQTIWERTGVVVLVESATFGHAGGIDAGYERMVKVEGRVRVDLRSDDLALTGLSEELVSDLVCNPVFLRREAVAMGAMTETARVPLQEFRIVPRDSELVHMLTFGLSGELLRFVGPGTLPDTVIVPGELQGIPA